MTEKTYHPIPEWLTQNYLEKVLRLYEKNDNLEVIELTLKPATAIGDNFCSIITRIKVKYELSSEQVIKERFFIVKSSFADDAYLAEVFEPYQTFATEMLMYDKILPALTALLDEINDNDKLFAVTIYVDYERTAIILEDLAVMNYISADRLKGFDLQHTQMALSKLAKMHAIAAVYNERVPGVLPKFDRGIFNHHTTVGLGPIFKNMLEVCAEYAGECVELGAYYKEKLLKLIPHVVECGVRAFEPKPNYFVTLAHGDYWINNIMLKYEDNGMENNTRTLQDMLMIDMQYSCWATPAVDLHYLFNTSLQAELRFAQEHDLFTYYYEILVETLKALQFSGRVPTLNEFFVELEASRFYAVTSSLVVQPLAINDNNEAADFKTLLLHDEHCRRFRKSLYDNANVQHYVKALLPDFDRRGLLDVPE